MYLKLAYYLVSRLLDVENTIMKYVYISSLTTLILLNKALLNFNWQIKDHLSILNNI